MYNSPETECLGNSTGLRSFVMGHADDPKFIVNLSECKNNRHSESEDDNKVILLWKRPLQVPAQVRKSTINIEVEQMNYEKYIESA